MSKPIKETITTIHKLKVVGTYDNDALKIQPEDEDEKELKRLFKKFDGEYVEITIGTKTENELDPDEVEEE